MSGEPGSSEAMAPIWELVEEVEKICGNRAGRHFSSVTEMLRATIDHALHSKSADLERELAQLRKDVGYPPAGVVQSWVSRKTFDGLAEKHEESRRDRALLANEMARLSTGLGTARLLRLLAGAVKRDKHVLAEAKGVLAQQEEIQRAVDRAIETVPTYADLVASVKRLAAGVDAVHEELDWPGRDSNRIEEAVKAAADARALLALLPNEGAS